MLVCGRRWGKSELLKRRGLHHMLLGNPYAWFAPTYKLLTPMWDEALAMLRPIVTRSDKTERRIECVTGGVWEWWTMDGGDPARGRKYAEVGIDEAAMVPRLGEIWQAAIRPTLSDMRGGAWMATTPRGIDDAWDMYMRGQDPDRADWMSWQMPTASNPYIHPDEIASAERDLPRWIFEQEYLAIPSDSGANPFGLAAIRDCVGHTSNEPVRVWGWDLARSVDYTVGIGMDRRGNVVQVERWQGVSWRETAERIAEITGRTYGFVDATGVGDVLVEQLHAMGCPLEPFVFTSPSKQELMSRLMIAIDGRQIAYPDGVIRSELESMEYSYTASRRVRYEARTGMHDDAVMALGLAVRALDAVGWHTGAEVRPATQPRRQRGRMDRLRRLR